MKIKFMIENEYDTILYKIFNGIDLTQYNCKIEEEEVYNEIGQDFFDKLKYTGKELEEIIKKPHYPNFLNLQFYTKDIVNNSIQNYEQFINSKCEMAIHIVDSIFVEVYSKSRENMERICRNINDNNFSNINFYKEQSLDNYRE